MVLKRIAWQSKLTGFKGGVLGEKIHMITYSLPVAVPIFDTLRFATGWKPGLGE